MFAWSHCQGQRHQCAHGVRVHSDPELGLHSIVNKEPLKETSAVVCKLPDAVKAHISNLLANCDN
jgi:hypothetical protein